MRLRCPVCGEYAELIRVTIGKVPDVQISPTSGVVDIWTYIYLSKCHRAPIGGAKVVVDLMKSLGPALDAADKPVEAIPLQPSNPIKNAGNASMEAYLPIPKPSPPSQRSRFTRDRIALAKKAKWESVGDIDDPIITGKKNRMDLIAIEIFHLIPIGKPYAFARKDISRMLNEKFNPPIHQSTILAKLAKLEKEGRVRHFTERNGDTGRPIHRYYRMSTELTGGNLK